MFWLYLAAWVWLLGTLITFSLFWLVFEDMWADAEADEVRPSNLPVAAFVLSIAATWPVMFFVWLVFGKPKRRKRR